MGIPGKTAPLLLRDLLTYDPRFEELAGRNLLTSPPPQHDSSALGRSYAVPSKNCRHELQLKEEQSALPQQGTDPDQTTIYKIAAICPRCRWHFDIVVDFRDDGSKNSPCRKSNHEFPLHHFLFNGELDQERAGSLGDQAKPRTYNFGCSAAKCPVELRIRMSPPRFTDLDIRVLTDRAHLRRRWEDSKQISGMRADADMARSIDAPDFLNTYLQDSFKNQKGKRRIPLLNRKFLKTFGRDCDEILRKLGFTDALEQEDDGSPAEVWYLPTPGPVQNPLDTFEPTIRNIIEDARYELNAIILARPESERSTARHVPMHTTPARKYIEMALDCDDYELRTNHMQTRSTSHEEDHPYYAGLGTLADFADSLLLFAYQRQVDVDQKNTPYYFECLQDLSVGRKSETLQSEVAVLASKGYSNRSEVAAAYRCLAIDPAHVDALSDEIITNQFRSRLSDISPSMAQESRKALLVIGIARNSDRITREASDAIETYQQALSWLDLDDENTSDDFVLSMFVMKTSDNPVNKETGRKAIKIIADHRKSQRLWGWLETGDMDVAEMDAAEAYATLSIPDRTSKLDLGILQSQVTMMMESDPQNTDRLRLAHEKVRQHQEATFGKSYDFQERSTVNYPLESWPVGCCNIGNTCYLNSVLQFLFTIKPLRDMVLDCDAHLQELSPEALAPKRVGRTAVTRARAETGQKFVRELHTLFRHMIAASTHNIRPARSLAALALTRGESADTVIENSNDGNTLHSGLGKVGDLPISGPMPPPGFNASRPPTPADSVMDDSNDAEGDADSMKAMDLTADSNGTGATEPDPPSRPPPIPPRPQATADIGLKELEDVAQQQDAAEILNNVFDLVSCAIKGESTLRDGEQLDLIKRLFFSDVTTVRRSNGEVVPKTDLQDNVLVSTKGRDRTLCAALDDEFGLTELENGATKYEFFEEASPIQIINVRRLQFEMGQARKDESHLALDKVLYLDRYLKKTKTLSEEQLQELRNQQWQLQSELRSLECRKQVLKETEFKDVDLPGVLDETACVVEKLYGELPELTSESGLPSSSPETSPELGELKPARREDVSNRLSQRADELRPELAEIHARMDTLEREIDSVFENCQDHPYRLHAIFMHAGSHRGGHYWIYIYDFQNNMWRKYNDETVTEESEDSILQRVQQDRAPTSTGIVYVREDVATEFTEAVCRMPEAREASNDQGDVEMRDVVDLGAHPVVKMDDFTHVQVIHGVEE